MPLAGIDLICADCDACKRAQKALNKKKTSGKMRAAKAMATGGISLYSEGWTKGMEKLDTKVREGEDCSICSHDNSGHDGKIKDPGWAFPPAGGDFGFEPDDAIGIRAAICLQAAATTSELNSQLAVETPYDLIFLHDRLEVYEITGGQLASEVQYSNLSALEIGGPGEQTSGGGFMGGGFGLAGFAVGAVASGVLNKLTTKTSIQTLIRVETQLENVGSAEWMFLTGVADTSVVDMTLRPITLLLTEQARRRESEVSTHGSTPGEGQDKVARLKELTELRDAGALDEEEFARLKAEILSS